jgi:hypothetical protein
MPVRSFGLAPDDAAFDVSVPTKHAATDSGERIRPRAEAEDVALVVR